MPVSRRPVSDVHLSFHLSIDVKRYSLARLTGFSCGREFDSFKDRSAFIGQSHCHIAQLSVQAFHFLSSWTTDLLTATAIFATFMAHSDCISGALYAVYEARGFKRSVDSFSHLGLAR